MESDHPLQVSSTGSVEPPARSPRPNPVDRSAEEGRRRRERERRERRKPRPEKPPPDPAGDSEPSPGGKGGRVDVRV